MKNVLWKTFVGGFATAVFCVAACTHSFGAEAKSVEDMEKELNSLKASVSNLTEQLESVKQEKTSSTKEDVDALKNEVNTLKEDIKTANQAAEQSLKAEDIAGNVYSEFAKRVKLGGQFRTRAEYANGFYQTPTSNATLGGAIAPMGRTPNQAATPHASEWTDDGYIMQQSRLWADADVNEHLRMFIQLQDARVWGAEGSTVGSTMPGAENSVLDLHQGYFDIKKLFELPLTVRVGRQEIIWGDHRVIGNFVWSNYGRVFDAARFLWDTDTIHAEVIAAKVDEDGYFAVDGTDNSDENMYAAQLGFKKLVPGALLELMYIQKNDQDGSAANATLAATGYAKPGDSPVVAGVNPNNNHPGVVIHDMGVRIDGKIPELDAVDYTVESHGQLGDYGTQDQEAWAFAGKGGYTFKDVSWKPRLGFEYCYASGDDDPTDGDHETFDNLYPTNHWQGIYGFADLVSWQNMHDLRGQIKVQPTSKMFAQVDYHYFLLAEEKDGWYLANGSLATPRGAYNTSDDELAQEVDLTVGYDLYKNVKVLAGYSWFGAEDWIENNIGEIDTNWVYLQTTVTF